MPLFSITRYIDGADAAFWLFIVGFVEVVIYLRRLDKREGYPMKASPFDDTPSLGFPLPLAPHTFELNEGGTTVAPHHYPQAPISARPLHGFAGTPLVPIGNPLLAGVGPGAWVMRSNEPMLTEKGELMLQPLRLLDDWSMSDKDADPRGMAVLDRRWRRIGVVGDVWIDRSTKAARLFEVTLDSSLATGPVLVPLYHPVIDEKTREMRVTALEAHQFAEVPRPVHDDRITAREDERLNAYYAAGEFWRGSRATAAPLIAGLEDEHPIAPTGAIR